MSNVLTKIIHFINNQKKKQENISFQRFPTVVIFAHCVCQNAHPLFFVPKTQLLHAFRKNIEANFIFLARLSLSLLEIIKTDLL